MKRNSLIFIIVLVLANTAFAAAPRVDVHGWLNAEYGYNVSGRYGLTDGKDRLGVQQAALTAMATYKNYYVDLQYGGDNFSNGTGDGGDMLFRTAVVGYDAMKDRNYKFEIGSGAILFGLKPSGFPGDRSLKPSVEYGGQGNFNVSQQAPLHVKFDYKLYMMDISVGAFDTSESKSDGTEGSGLIKNYFAQVRMNELFMDGLYGNFGYEGYYVGSTIAQTKPLYIAGLGYENSLFDISIEYMNLHKNIASLNATTIDTITSSDNYWIAELTVKLTKKWMAYFDWADSEEQKADSLRVGTKYVLNDWSHVQLEYSQDKAAYTASEAEGVDFRWHMHF